MTLHRVVLSLCLAAAFVLYVAAPLAAAPLTWTIDSTKSKISLAVPDQVIDIDVVTSTVRARNQSATGGGNSAWNVGNTAFLSGTIDTNFVPLGSPSIEFLSASVGQIVGLDSGSYRPNPAAFNSANTNVDNPGGQFENSSTAPAVYGFRARLTGAIPEATDLGHAAIDDVSYQLSSGALPITGGSFPVNSGLTFGIQDAMLRFDGLPFLVVGQPLPDGITSISTLVGANASGDSGTVALVGFVWHLAIPISLSTTLNLEGVPLAVNMTGTIYATAVPEPSSLALAGISGALIVSALRLRRPRR